MKRLLVVVLVAVCCSAALAQDPQVDQTGGASAASRQAIMGRPAGPALSGEPLNRKAAEVAALLRCPVCQGLSIEGSPASMAVNMKREVRDLLAEGYSEDQVLAYFERSYGEFVRLQPPLRGVNWLVWLAPIAALVAGIFIVMRLMRPRPTVSATRNEIGDSPAPEPARQQPDFDPYLEQVRRLAYTKDDEAGGQPGGTARGKK